MDKPSLFTFIPLHFLVLNQIYVLFISGYIDENPFIRHPFCEIQDGGHVGIRGNGNIVFLVAYTIKFPKMYSFDTLHKNPTKLHYEPDYCVKI